MEEFNFCFSFNKISLNSYMDSSFYESSGFRFELRRHNDMLGSTAYIPYTLNDDDQIIISNQTIELRIQEKDRKVKQAYELRLIEMRQQSQEILIGSYEFVLYNYITAYKQLRRSCVELSIEISLDYTIDYEVYIERTTQALKRIINEHAAGRRLSFTEDAGEEQFFCFREQNAKDMQNKNIKEIKMGDISPIFLNQRFWSPFSKRPVNNKRLKTMGIPESSKLTTNQQTVESCSNKKSYTRIEGKQIEGEVGNNLSVSLTGNKMKNLLQMSIDCESENAGEQNLEQLYDVIQMGSKILIPGDENTVIVQPKRHLEQREIARLESSRLREQARSEGTMNADNSQPFKYYLIIFLCLLLSGGIIYEMMRPSPKIAAKKLQKSYRKK